MPQCPNCKCDLAFAVHVTAIKSQATQAKTTSPQTVDASDVGELLGGISTSGLDDGAFDFVKKTQERWAKYGDRIMMTDKQMTFLRKLASQQEDDEPAF